VSLEEMWGKEGGDRMTLLQAAFYEETSPKAKLERALESRKK